MPTSVSPNLYKNLSSLLGWMLKTLNTLLNTILPCGIKCTTNTKRGSVAHFVLNSKQRRAAHYDTESSPSEKTEFLAMGTLLNEHSIHVHGGGVCCENFRLLVLGLLVIIIIIQTIICCC
jgi:hypothetical protein